MRCAPLPTLCCRRSFLFLLGKALAKDIGAASYAEVACTSAPELQALLGDCMTVVLKRAKSGQNGCELL